MQRPLQLRFGRSIFKDNNLAINTVIGGVVYALGEAIGQSQKEDVQWTRVGDFFLLGAVENGLVMSVWYRYLDHKLGSKGATSIVLLKCFYDQVLFTTQEDLMFLAISALQSRQTLDRAFEQIKSEYLSTWIRDCSFWPFINFIAFVGVPMRWQAPYMALTQLSWQIYLTYRETKYDETHARKIFESIDADKNGFIDECELKTCLAVRGIDVSQKEIDEMIADGDTEEADGKISFEEFKQVLKNKKCRSKKLWQTVLDTNSLQYGTNAAIFRLEEMNIKSRNEVTIKEEIKISYIGSTGSAAPVVCALPVLTPVHPSALEPLAQPPVPAIPVAIPVPGLMNNGLMSKCEPALALTKKNMNMPCGDSIHLNLNLQDKKYHDSIEQAGLGLGVLVLSAFIRKRVWRI